MSRWLSIVLTSRSAPVHAAAGAMFLDGLAVYHAGRYAETGRIWSELARRGDAMAQLGLAAEAGKRYARERLIALESEMSPPQLTAARPAAGPLCAGR